MKSLDLRQDERIVVKSLGEYKLKGPGPVVLYPWETEITTLNLGITSETITLEEVNTRENTQIEIQVKVLYKVDPELPSEVLDQTQDLNYGGWKNILTWRTESVTRKLLSNYSWRDINSQNTQKRLEHYLQETLSPLLARIHLIVTECCIIYTKIPKDISETCEYLEELKEYASLAQTIPDIIKLEWLNAMRKNSPMMFAKTDLSDSPQRSEAIQSQNLDFLQIIPIQKEVTITQ